MSLANPFTAPLACLPTVPSIDSERVRVFVRGTMRIGTAGVGYVMANPFRMSYNNGLQDVGGDSRPVFYSNELFTGVVPAIATGAVPVPGALAANGNSPYTFAQFGAGTNLNQFRLVSAGIRIAYTSAEVNRGGVVYGLMQPNHETFVGQTSANLGAYDGTAILGVPNRDWATVLYRPVDPDDVDWVYTSTAPVIQAPFMGFLIESAAGNAFQFEVFATLEVSGSLARHKQPAEADAVGYSAVSSLASRHPEVFMASYDSVATRVGRFLGAASETLNRAASGVGQYALNKVESYGTAAAIAGLNYIGNRAAGRLGYAPPRITY